MRSLLRISLAVLLGATATSSNLADAVCTPTLTYTNTKLTVGVGETKNVVYIPGTTTAVGIATREIYDFDTTVTTGTITPNVRAGNVAAGIWAGDQTNGANARFNAYGGTMKPDGTMVYFGMGKSVGQVTLSGNYPVKIIAGDESTPGCAEGDGTAARLTDGKGPVIADATGDTVLDPVGSCHRLALVQTNSPHTLTHMVGTGNSATATAAGYGTSAPIKLPTSVTAWRDRFYACAGYGSPIDVLGIYPALNWKLVIITTGPTGSSTTNDIPFDNTFHSSVAFTLAGRFATWSNCWLQIFQSNSFANTGVGHIVDPEGGNMFLLAGIASGGASFASADLGGNVWVSGHAGNTADLGKHSIAYTGCPAMSPHKCKWGYMTATATATLQEVPPRTRTAAPPMTTPAPMTTAPVTTTAVSASASASSGSPATIAAATSAAATAAATTVASTTAAATTVASTTAAAITAAASTTAALSTTAAAGSTTSSSSASFFGNGNGASSVTAAAIGLVTMVLAML